MGNFSEKQLVILENNPYTRSVSKNRITYTHEFKEFIWNELSNGSSSVQAFVKAGYDPEIIGVTNIYSFAKRIKRKANQNDGSYPPESRKVFEKFQKKELEKARTKAAIKELQEQVICLEQEVEFLKKISAIRSKHLKKT